MKEVKLRNWAELPSELISSILLRLSLAERLQNAQKVCRSWRRACQDPSMWRRIDVVWSPLLRNRDEHMAVCRRAVDLSQGGLVEINIEGLATDSLLSYIADRSSNLKSLVLVDCDVVKGEGVLEAVMKLPLLERLEVSSFYTEELDLKATGLSCPNLKTLKLNSFHSYYQDECDDDALAIAETMPGLRHLQLTGNRLSNTGLNAIIESCPRLQRLDLRSCLYVNLEANCPGICSQSTF